MINPNGWQEQIKKPKEDYAIAMEEIKLGNFVTIYTDKNGMKYIINQRAISNFEKLKMLEEKFSKDVFNILETE